MKYTNKHIKEQYKFNQIWRTIGIILLLIGIFLVGFGLIQTKRKMDYVRPFEQVLQEESNPGNQTVYIDIIRVPEKLAEINMKDITLQQPQREVILQQCYRNSLQI